MSDSKYNRDTVIFKLSRKGIRLEEGYVVIPKDVTVGIKLWGMIDSLRTLGFIRGK